MFESEDELIKFGLRLMDRLHRYFAGSYFERQADDGEYCSLTISGAIRFSFRKWSGKPGYIILFSGQKFVFELDLSKAIESAKKYTWYLSRPHNIKNRHALSRILEWKSNVEPSYRDALRVQKRSLDSGSVVSKGGYLLVKDVTKGELETSFLELLDKIINIHLLHPSHQRKKLYDIDDARSIEGYQSDKRYLHTKRNQSLVLKRRQKDNFTCQVCGFRLQVKGHFIIECHHTMPLAGGTTRVTSIDELVCLCPTCHRMAHTQAPPFSVLEIKSLRKQKPHHKVKMRKR